MPPPRGLGSHLSRATPVVVWTVSLVSFALIVTGTVLVLFLGADTPVSMLYVSASLVAAPFLPLWGILLVTVVSCAVHAVTLVLVVEESGIEEAIRNANVITVALLALGINYIVRQGSQELATARNIAAAAQLAVLPVPPTRIGDLTIAARYEAAQVEANIGGDLYAVQETPYGTRMLVGDVRGKGLDAVGALSVVIGSFRESAEREVALSQVAFRLEWAMLHDAERRLEQRGDDPGENFMTAVLAEIPEGRPDLLRLINRGHPAPLLMLPDGEVRSLEPHRYELPLGMGLGPLEQPEDVVEVPFPDRAKLLIYTDGISEARDGQGVFYDPELQLGGRLFDGPNELLDQLITEVKKHTGGVVQDDMALLAVEHQCGEPRSTAG